MRVYDHFQSRRTRWGKVRVIILLLLFTQSSLAKNIQYAMLFEKMLYKWNFIVWLAYGIGFFHLVKFSVIHVSIHSFLLLNSILWCLRATICLIICQLKNICTVWNPWLSHIQKNKTKQNLLEHLHTGFMWTRFHFSRIKAQEWNCWSYNNFSFWGNC